MPVVHPYPVNWSGADVRADWAAFAAMVAKIADRLALVADDEALPIEAMSGELVGVVEGRDLKAKFEGVRWRLTRAPSRNGGVGAITSQFGTTNRLETWLYADANVEAQGLAGYAAWAEKGLAYLALHETAHVTLLGLRTWIDCWEAHRRDGGTVETYPTSAYWERNEEVANKIAQVAADRLELPLLPDPHGGFPETLIRRIGRRNA